MATTPAEVLRSLRKNRAVALGQIDKLLLRAIATGEAAASVAKKIGAYLSPWASPRRSETGGWLRRGRTGAVPSWPGQPGMGSAHARALMLHESNVAHGESVKRAAANRGRGVKWVLHPSHSRPDVCTDNRHRDVGFGAGIFPSNEVPMHPSHYACRCSLEQTELRAA